MTSATSFFQCDHLRSLTTPRGFTDDRVELEHTNEQIGLLDSHISQLNTLRYILHRRSCQLHNLLSPINTLPVEVLSYIFLQVAESGRCVDPNYDCHWDNLGPAFVLSSVSPYFRDVALGIPELWKRVALRITNDKTIDTISPLLQHCTAHGPNIIISVSDRCVREEKVRSAIETLVTSDTLQKVKAFALHDPAYASPWIPKLNGSLFPMIDSLIVTYRYRSSNHLSVFDFGTLNTMTRLTVSAPLLNFPIIVPPSIQYLKISGVSEEVAVSLLYQCPGLIECFLGIGDRLHDGTLFDKPLILNQLKRLYARAMDAIELSSSAQYLRTPSLESLHLHLCEGSDFGGIIILCRNASATLTTLIIDTTSPKIKKRDLNRLWRSTLPKLRHLEFLSYHLESFMTTLLVLGPRDGERSNPRPHNLPALKSVTLGLTLSRVEPRDILNFLNAWWTDESLYLHLKLESNKNKYEDWSPALRDELKSVVGGRQIELTYGKAKIQKLPVIDDYGPGIVVQVEGLLLEVPE